MHALLFFASFLPLLAVCSAWTTGETYILKAFWHIWKKEHKKAYVSPVEEQHRQDVFFSNLDFIFQHNRRFYRGLETYQVRVNAFSDLTPREFADRYLCLRRTPKSKSSSQLATFIPVDGKLPDSVDWRKKGAVTPVKDQVKS